MNEEDVVSYIDTEGAGLGFDRESRMAEDPLGMENQDVQIPDISLVVP